MISSCLAQLRSRLGVARVIISELKADGKDVEATSQLQAAACEEILAKGFKELDTAQKADLAELAHKAGFQDAHLQLILQRLVKSKAGGGRRESQDFTAFLHYGSANDWDSIESGTEEEIDDALCQILIRLNCVNPCEQTKKVLASAALVAFYKKAVIPEAVKSAKFVSIKNKFDKTRRFLKKQETKTGVHAHYLLRLPKNPSQLLALSPELHARADLSGFASPRLDKNAMSLVSAAFSCRGHEKRVGVATTAVDAKDASSKADMMQAILMMQTMFLQGGMQGRQDSEDDLGCNITMERPGGNQKKRCIQAMFGNHSSGRPSLRRASTIKDDTTASRAGSVEAPRTPSRNPQTALELQTPSMKPQTAAASMIDLADADLPPPPSPPPLELPGATAAEVSAAKRQRTEVDTDVVMDVSAIGTIAALLVEPAISLWKDRRVWNSQKFPLEAQVKGREREVQHLVHFDAVADCATPDEGDTVCDMIWVEEWRGDEVRSRLAVRQLRGEKRLDTFAAMPDSFFVRFQLLKCSANKDFAVLIIDVSVAFMHADIEEEINVKVPAGIESATGFWRLLKALNDTQKESQSWCEH